MLKLEKLIPKDTEIIPIIPQDKIKLRKEKVTDPRLLQPNYCEFEGYLKSVKWLPPKHFRDCTIYVCKCTIQGNYMKGYFTEEYAKRKQTYFMLANST